MVMMVVRKIWQSGGRAAARRAVSKYGKKNRAVGLAWRIVDVFLSR